ncbi:MAG: hypothetical protein RBU30_04045 [Polyangia bacterium]|jgi:hypothetical protein|nr:hypothetical protein [Polyangia bacterium]
MRRSQSIARASGLAALLAAFLGQSSCLVSFSSGASCGDGLLDPGEECDDGPGNSDTGADACRTDCTRARCGDGVVDNLEDCDGSNLAGATCASVLPGLVGGALGCDERCRFVLTGCNGCGNGYVEPGEVCDGTDLDAQSCQTFAGLAHGSLGCSVACELDASGCHECGNGSVEGPEVCEPTDLGGRACADMGDYNGGLLACGDGCLSLDDSGCFNCGDGQCDASRGEDLSSCPADCQCLPEEERECSCPGWELETQTCGADAHWSVCICPACASATHDEDGDGVLDECDNCPDVANTAQTNGDGDRLGNSCEAPSNQTLFGEGLYFESFELSAALPNWSIGQYMTWGADQMLADTTACGDNCYSNSLWQEELSGYYGISARFSHDAASDGWSCLMMGYGESKSWLICCLQRYPTTPSALQIWRLTPPSSLNKVAETTGADSASHGTVRRLFMYWDGAVVRCDSSNTIGESSSVTLTGVQNSWTQGLSGVRVYRERASFLSFAVVR